MACKLKIHDYFIVGDKRQRAEIVDTYGCATVADLKELIGYIPNYTDNMYGWVDVKHAEVQKRNGRYGILIPRPLLIDNVPDRRDMSPAAILDMITSMHTPEEYTYIILGQPGPTGKTWLRDRLESRGFKAIEISEDVIKYVNYDKRSGNSVTFDDFDKHVTIILNELYKK